MQNKKIIVGDRLQKKNKAELIVDVRHENKIKAAQNDVHHPLHSLRYDPQTS